jgi:hypothetical protein
MEEKYIAKEMVDTYLWRLEQKGMLQPDKYGKAELERFARFIMDEYELTEALREIFADELADIKCEEDSYSLQDIERQAYNDIVLKPQIDKLNRM